MSIRKRAEEIFLELLDLPQDEWPRRMASACGDDSALQRELEAIVAADAGSWSPSSPAIVSASPGTRTPEVGSSIGPYRLTEQIARGGFGVVFRARQESPIQRDVAVKIIKLGLDTEEVIRRFELERRVLALLDHPHIAKVHDAGTTPEGRPYFVMEYVRGEPITDYCDHHMLSIEARLELVVQIAEAVQHAHQKGIIHRDLKPGNVLVAEHDGRPFVKVIDFGIAKAMDRGQYERTISIAQGSLIGTPEYMSPEQAESSLDIDTRTDTYSLGVILYELLTGITPFDPEELRSASYSEMQRIIREVEPPRPSTRLAPSSTTIAAVAASRGVEPHRLGTFIRGDLDWITLKAMEKDRARRYESASALAMDILRHLRHEPIVAGHPSTMYRVRKFVRRNRVAVLAVMLVGAALVAGIIATTLESVRARNAELSALRRAYSASMLSVSDALERGQIDAARHFLEDAPPGLRGWEWRHLSSRMDFTERVHERPRDMWAHILPMPDGWSYWEVSMNPADGIRRYDVETDRLLATIPTHKPCWRAWLVANGDRIALEIPDRADGPQVIELWDLKSGTCSWSSQPIYDLVDVARDGTRMAYIHDQRVYVIDVPSGATRTSARLATTDASGQQPLVRFQPDGKRLAVCDSAGEFKLFDTETLELLVSFESHDNSATTMAFSDDSRLFATGSLDRTICITNVAASPPIPVATLRGHINFLMEVCFSPDGTLLASCSPDRTVRLWDTRTGSPRGVFSSEVRNLCFLAAGQLVAAGDPHGVRFWNVGAADAWVLRGHSTYVYPVMLSPDGATIYSGGWDGFAGEPGSLRVWDAPTGEPIAAMGTADSYVRAAALSPDGSRLAISVTTTKTSASHIEILDAGTGRTIHSISAGDTSRNADDCVVFDPSGRFVAWGDLGHGSVRVADVLTGAVRESKPGPALGRESAAIRVAWSPDGTTIAMTRGTDPRLNLLDAQTLATARHWLHRHNGGIFSLTFSPDGRRILSTASDGIARIWDARTGEAVQDLVGHGSRVLCAAYSPNGERIASGGDDNNIRLWDAETFGQVARLGGHEDYVYAVAWRADSEQLISSSGDHTVRVWDTQPLKDRVQARLDRREVVSEVEPMVEGLFDRFGDVPKVIEAVKADATLTPRARQVALQIILRVSVERQARPENQAHN